MQSAGPGDLGEPQPSAGPGRRSATSSPGSTSRTSVAPTMSSAHVSDATQNPFGQPPDRQRPDAQRIAGRVHAPLVHEDEAERARERRQELAARPPPARSSPCCSREHGRDDVGVGGRAPRAPAQLGELVRVDQVPVVAQRDRAHAVGLEDRLRVLPRASTRSSSTGCARSPGRPGGWPASLR